MIVHLGQDVAALEEDILLILDIARGIPEESRAFLEALRLQGRVEKITDDAAKSAVILKGRKGEIRAFLSPISSAVLCQRLSAHGVGDPYVRGWEAPIRAD